MKPICDHIKPFASALLCLLFLLGSLMPQGSFAELAKFPALVNHYHHHLASSGRHLSFFAFLKLHYSDTQHERDNKNDCEHEKLPLQSHVASAALIFAAPAAYFKCELAAKPDTRTTELPGRIPLSGYSFSVWQPPKAA